MSIAMHMRNCVSNTIKLDHHRLTNHYNHIIGSIDKVEQKKYKNLFITELVHHSTAEEIVMYPALEEYVAGGSSLANRDRLEYGFVCCLPYGMRYSIS